MAKKATIKDQLKPAIKQQPEGGIPVKGKKAVKRAAKTKPSKLGAASSRRTTPNELKTQVSRSVKAGAGTKRGNRRDTHPSFSTGKTHAKGGRAGPLGRSTRKSGPDTAAGHTGARNRGKAKK